MTAAPSSARTQDDGLDSPGAERRERLSQVWADVARSTLSWRIWVRLGLQDVRVRFRRSIIGPGWIFLNLTVMVLALGYVYSHLLRQEVREFLPFLTAGLVTWGYLASSVTDGAQAFVSSEGYIKQIGAPIYIYLLRFFVAITATAIISLGAFPVAALIFGSPLGLGQLWILPGAALIMVASLLIITIMAHVNARFRDAGNIASMGVQIGFFVTPVLFPPELLLEHGRAAVVQLNPFYHLLEVVRRPLLAAEPAAAINYAGAATFDLLLLVVAIGVMAHFGRRVVFSL